MAGRARGRLPREFLQGRGGRAQLYFPIASELTVKPVFEPHEFDRAEPALILVGDDDPAVRRIILNILEQHGFQTMGAEDGEQAVELAIEYLPALVILDGMMPKMDGYTALTRLRGNAKTREIPVIILTGETDGVYKGLSKGLGAVDHITKPFTADGLIEGVRHSLPGRGE